MTSLLESTHCQCTVHFLRIKLLHNGTTKSYRSDRGEMDHIPSQTMWKVRWQFWSQNWFHSEVFWFLLSHFMLYLFSCNDSCFDIKCRLSDLSWLDESVFLSASEDNTMKGMYLWTRFWYFRKLVHADFLFAVLVSSVCWVEWKEYAL